MSISCKIILKTQLSSLARNLCAHCHRNIFTFYKINKTFFSLPAVFITKKLHVTQKTYKNHLINGLGVGQHGFNGTV